ncbi:MAG: hypothetical protein JNM63_14865, partial [Spirochaetia bacterium]|nr:hypothetical protein [Spirochaetia bacterium]
DVVQEHSYDFNNTANLFYFSRILASRHKKPFIPAEFGVMGGQPNQSPKYESEKDEKGIGSHLGHWSTALSTAAASAMDWYLSSYEKFDHLWDDFSRLRAFVSDLPRTDPDLKEVEALVKVSPGQEISTAIDVVIAPPQKWAKPDYSEYRIADDGSFSPPATTLNGILWGQVNHPEFRNPPVFSVRYKNPGRFVVHVMEVVGKGSNPIQIEIDGKEALFEDLVCEVGKGLKSEKRGEYAAVTYNRDLVIDVPAGEHKIKVDNRGVDRSTVTYKLEGYATRETTPGITVAGLSHTKGAHIWMVNRTWSPEMLIGAGKHAVARDVWLVLSGLKDGNASVLWIDPMTGKELRTESVSIKSGKVSLSARDLPTDLGCKIRYL